jgi:hypothetical protein
MFIVLHVIIALSSVAYTTYLLVAPTKLKFYVTYGLVGLTLISGTYLVVSRPAHILSACESGLLYIGLVLTGIVAAKYRLAHQPATIRHD